MKAYLTSPSGWLKQRQKFQVILRAPPQPGFLPWVWRGRGPGCRAWTGRRARLQGCSSEPRPRVVQPGSSAGRTCREPSVQKPRPGAVAGRGSPRGTSGTPEKEAGRKCNPRDQKVVGTPRGSWGGGAFPARPGPRSEQHLQLAQPGGPTPLTRKLVSAKA